MENRTIIARLNTALNQIDAVYDVIAKKHNLTYNSLMTIYMICEDENVTQKQICDTLYIPKSTVHSILNSFVEKGFVYLEQGANYKEKKLSVTEEGKVYFGSIMQEMELVENRALMALGDKNSAQLLMNAEKLAAYMNDALSEIMERRL